MAQALRVDSLKDDQVLKKPSIMFRRSGLVHI